MSRAQTITAERRRRNTAWLSGRRQRLAVDESKLDRENFTYRWVNDDPTSQRVYDLTTNDDWERVVDRDGALKTNSTGMGAEVAAPAGVGDTGSPVRAVLLRKPKDWHDEDQAAKQRHIDGLEAGMKAGHTPGASGEGFYRPKDRDIRIGRGE